MIESFNIEAFIDGDTGTIRMYAADKSEIGSPCVEIPATKEALYRWAYELMKCADELDAPEDPFNLPGFFGVLTDPNGDV